VVFFVKAKLPTTNTCRSLYGILISRVLWYNVPTSSHHKQCNRVRSQSYDRYVCVCVGGGGELSYRDEYKGGGGHSMGRVREQIMPALWLCLLQIIWTCVLTLQHHFHSSECLFWHALPYIVCYFTCLTVGNYDFLHLRQCHSILWRAVFVASQYWTTQNDLCSVTACNQLTRPL
jgi:hypothetical protein